ncbi:MAG: IS110 family transposase [Acidobacteriaceae bacterium]|nr:IS110 family transposase [Acidobacteriaceae bacterium]
MPSEYRRCCGIDVHKKSVNVCVLPPLGKDSSELKQETFRTFTRDLKRLRVWLLNCKVTEIVMESTGQYWRPVWNILEGAFTRLVLVNPQHVKGLKGRKTDRIDAHWLATKLQNEDLKGSFIPPREIRELRELTRLRVHWLQDLNRVKNRIGELCESGNIKISSVASHLFGESGRRMLAALVRGDRDAGWMADYARGTLRGRKYQLELALQGTFSDHQRSLLADMLQQFHTLEQQIADLTAKIECRAAVYEDVLKRIDTIPGFHRISAWTVLAEIGTDMGVFEDARHLASWAALCPGIRESGGKRMSGKTRKGNPYLRRALCQSAWAAARKKDSYLTGLFRRIRARRGEQKAIMAVAHQLLTILFHVIRDGTVYQELGAAHYDQQNQPKITRKLVERLQRLGYYVTLQPVENPIEPASTPCLDTPPAERPPSQRRRGRPCKCAQRGIACKHISSLAHLLPENPPNLPAAGIASP